MNRRPIGLALLLALAFGSSSASAQDETPTAVTNQNRTGDLPFSTSIGTDVEHVDVASGNLIVRIPITSVPGRGMNYNFALNYDAMLWAVATRTTGGVTYQRWNIEKRDWLPAGGLGWAINQSRISYVYSEETCGQNAFGAPTGTVAKTEAFIYHDSNGGKHPLTIRDEAGDSCNLGTGSYWAGVTEGPDETEEGIWASFALAPQILMADGTKDKSTAPRTLVEYTPGVWKYQTLYGDFLDSNGNKKKEVPGGLDTLGRVIVTRQDLTNQVLYKLYDTDGVLRTYTVNYSNISFLTNFNISGGYGPVQEVGGTRPAISSVVLPNGRSYSFQYETNTYGGLTRIDLPTGAYVTYTWGTYLNGEETHRYVTNRTLHVGGLSYTWTFLRSCSDPPYCDQPQITVTDPLGNQSVYLVSSGKVLSAKFYQGAATGNPVRQHTLDYNGNPVTGSAWLLIRINTTLEDGRVSKKEFDYEYFTYHEETCPNPATCGDSGTTPVDWTASRGNVLEIREYEYGAVPGTYGQGVPGALARRTTKEYLHNANGEYLSRNIVSKIIKETVFDGSNPTATACTVGNGCKAKTEFEYDSTAITATSGAPQHDYTNFPSTFIYRGNATRVKKWRNTDGALLATSYIYDDLGNIRSITDPGLHTTTWDYNDNWSGTGCLPPANSLAYVKQATNHLGHRIQLSRFPCTGAVQSRKDENDLINARPGITFTYDLFGRLLTKVETDGGQSTNAYNDVPPVSATSTSKITSTLNLVSTAIQDDLGRVKQTQLTSDPEGTVYTDTTYDALGRAKTVTSPYRQISDPTYGVTETQYDALGRVTKVIPPDGTPTSNNVSTVYGGPTVTVTDQAGKVRKSEADALGRLLRVWEPNSSGSLVNKTRYFYDTLDNLTCVLQLSTDAEPASCTSPSATYRPRTFTYNSLSQLLTATNPESGTITYTYDADGNVLTKVTPKPNQTGGLTVSTTFSYDSLHRLTSKTYSNGDPAATLVYDVGTPGVWYQQQNMVGRVVRSCWGPLYNDCDYFGYDALGRLNHQDRWNLTLAYTYDLAGDPTRIQYYEYTAAKSRLVDYTYNGAGRVTQVQEASGAGTVYASGILYHPHGAWKSMNLANGALRQTADYNNRLQPVVKSAEDLSPLTTLMSFSYSFDQQPGSGVINNGNPVAVTDAIQNLTYNYSYDELNRLATAQTTSNLWGNSYVYDIWGNLTNMNPVAGKTYYQNLQAAPASTKNQLTGFTHDAAGNLTADVVHNYQYDAENRLQSVDAGAATYAYTPDGARVKKTVSETTTWFISGAGVLEEVTSGVWAKDYVYLGGALLATESASQGTRYHFADHLGTPRLVTSPTGAVVCRHDYYPYGKEVGTCTEGETHKFTGKERDAESGLDYFGLRYYASGQGRFSTADLPFADQHASIPQSWNLYGYARGNPLSLVDPTGRGAISYIVKAARQLGVRLAWRQEKQLVAAAGKGTRKWTEAQKQELLKKGKVKGFEGHHINSVKGHPEMAGDPNNVAFVKGRKGQLEAHGGNFRNETSGPLLDRSGFVLKAAIFFQVFDEDLSKVANSSPLVSNPDSRWSLVNPYNSFVESAVFIDALLVAAVSEEGEEEKEGEENEGGENKYSVCDCGLPGEPRLPDDGWPPFRPPRH